jgi:hypothetical protein
MSVEFFAIHPETLRGGFWRLMDDDESRRAKACPNSKPKTQNSLRGAANIEY